MGILNVTPDSFSDGGKFIAVETAAKHAERLISEGADILDIGGESTRPNGIRVSSETEIERVVPVIRAIREISDIPISIDTSKSEVAAEALKNGAEIVNDISGLRFDKNTAKVAAEYGAGLVLMNSRGNFDQMHRQISNASILTEVSSGFNESLEVARLAKINEDQICLDVGIGFSKTVAQNLELIAKLDKLIEEFDKYPMLIGTSRKSFIGKVLGDVPVQERSVGTNSTNAIAIWNGAHIVRVHDVKDAVDNIKMVAAIKREL